jgi:hypothetical protein
MNEGGVAYFVLALFIKVEGANE